MRTTILFSASVITSPVKRKQSYSLAETINDYFAHKKARQTSRRIWNSKRGSWSWKENDSS